MSMVETLLDAMKSWHSDPITSARKLREVAAKMIIVAEKLEIQSHDNPWMSNNGLSDKVKINVMGPDGQIKQTATQG